MKIFYSLRMMIIPNGIERGNMLTKHLNAILTETNTTCCYFAGGSLFIDNPNGKGGFFHINPPCDASSSSYLYEEDWTIPITLTENQKKLYAQIYLKHKTENHAYWNTMKEIAA